MAIGVGVDTRLRLCSNPQDEEKCRTNGESINIKPHCDSDK